MIVKVYREMGKNKRSRGERTNPYKNYNSSPQELYFVQKGKEMARIGHEQGKIRRHHCSTLAGNILYKEV
jgi:hypothetical protein